MNEKEKEARKRIADLHKRHSGQGADAIMVTKKGGRPVDSRVWGHEEIKDGLISRLLKLPPKTHR